MNPDQYFKPQCWHIYLRYICDIKNVFNLFVNSEYPEDGVFSWFIFVLYFVLFKCPMLIYSMWFSPSVVCERVVTERTFARHYVCMSVCL